MTILAMFQTPGLPESTPWPAALANLMAALWGITIGVSSIALFGRVPRSIWGAIRRMAFLALFATSFGTALWIGSVGASVVPSTWADRVPIWGVLVTAGVLPICAISMGLHRSMATAIMAVIWGLSSIVLAPDLGVMTSALLLIPPSELAAHVPLLLAQVGVSHMLVMTGVSAVCVVLLPQPKAVASSSEAKSTQRQVRRVRLDRAKQAFANLIACRNREELAGETRQTRTGQGRARPRPRR